jgi:DNA modification methylase
MNYPDEFVDKIILGDCLDLMKKIPDGVVDMVLTDLPYQVTSRNSWDVIIPFEPMWELIGRVAKENAALIFTATQPFASQLIMSNPKWFKFDLIWRKNKVHGHLNAKKMPLRNHEQILVFYRKQPTYNPQKTTGHKPVNSYTHHVDSSNYGATRYGFSGGGSTERYPVSVLDFPVLNNDSPERIHPTQKPVQLFEWLIRTYTNEGEVILDPCIGSGTTFVAAKNLGRRCIGIEKNENYHKLANERIAKNPV